LEACHEKRGYELLCINVVLISYSTLDIRMTYVYGSLPIHVGVKLKSVEKITWFTTT
jgi:hypothetical protein